MTVPQTCVFLTVLRTGQGFRRVSFRWGLSGVFLVVRREWVWGGSPSRHILSGVCAVTRLITAGVDLGHWLRCVCQVSPLSTFHSLGGQSRVQPTPKAGVALPRGCPPVFYLFDHSFTSGGGLAGVYLTSGLEPCATWACLTCSALTRRGHTQ